MNLRATLFEAFGHQVRTRRKDLGLTQGELGGRTGLHRTYIADVERGCRNPSLETVAKLALGLKLKPSQLCKGIDAATQR